MCVAQDMLPNCCGMLDTICFSRRALKHAHTNTEQDTRGFIPFKMHQYHIESSVGLRYLTTVIDVVLSKPFFYWSAFLLGARNFSLFDFEREHTSSVFLIVCCVRFRNHLSRRQSLCWSFEKTSTNQWYQLSSTIGGLLWRRWTHKRV